jgi:uncharacterized protein (UPF0276 family)
VSSAEGRRLGHGVGLRPQHYAEILEHGPHGVEWFEAISENYFAPGGRPWAVLERARRELPVVLHGVSMGIGNFDRLSESYLDQLQQVIDRIQPAWVSDHLCWGACGGKYAHDLLPLPYTRETMEHVVSRIDAVQNRLRRRIMLENVSAYLEFSQSDLEECDVLNEVADRTGCSLLVDVNNVYVCSRNLGWDAGAYLDAIEPRHVGQIHLAGHSVQGDLIIDTHVGPVPDPVWDLYRRALQRFGRVPTLIEWDDEVPTYAELVAESRRAADIEREVLKEVVRAA